MPNVTATCPVTGRNIFPGTQIPYDWDGKGNLMIVCPACNRPHEWDPFSGTLRDIDLDDELDDEQ